MTHIRGVKPDLLCVVLCYCVIVGGGKESVSSIAAASSHSFFSPAKIVCEFMNEVPRCSTTQHPTVEWSGRRLFSSVSGGGGRGEAANNDDDDNDDAPVVAATEATLSPSALHFPD